MKRPLTADGFDDAIIGIGERCGQTPLVVYSVEKAIGILMNQGMNYEEAQEYFDFNVLGSWMGEGTPMWVGEADIDTVTEYFEDWEDEDAGDSEAQ